MEQGIKFAFGEALCGAPLLIPCDHCGGAADYICVENGRYAAKCMQCGMQTGAFVWPGQAGEVWNRRATTHARIITLDEIAETVKGPCACWFEVNPTIELSTEAHMWAVIAETGINFGERTAHVSTGVVEQEMQEEYIAAEGIEWRLWDKRPSAEERAAEPWAGVKWRPGRTDAAIDQADELRSAQEAERERREQEKRELWTRVCLLCDYTKVHIDEAGNVRTVCRKDGHTIEKPSREKCDDWTKRGGAAHEAARQGDPASDGLGEPDGA